MKVDHTFSHSGGGQPGESSLPRTWSDRQYSAELLKLTELCVACALCLPHCPTYKLTGKETDSPRGRVWLMRGLAQGDLEVTDNLKNHLDRCTGCRACEAMCPSKVEYGKALNLSLALTVHNQPAQTSLISNIVIWQKTIALLAKVYRGIGMQFMFRHSGLSGFSALSRWDSLLQSFIGPAQFKNFYPTKVNSSKKTLALFTGCLGKTVESNTIRAAITLLNHLGYDVNIPDGQACCGAMVLHEGRTNESERLQKTNIETFAHAEVVLTCASSCSATLKDYGVSKHRQVDLGQEAESFSGKVMDIIQFLEQKLDQQKPGFLPLNKTIAVHESCSLRNVLKSGESLYELVKKIPDATVLPLDGNELCCGGSGAYMFKQKALSMSLLNYKIAALKELKPDILVTTSMGCRLQLQSGLTMAGLATEVLHPVELLARQLKTEKGEK